MKIFYLSTIQNILKNFISFVILICFLSSCAFFNETKVDVKFANNINNNSVTELFIENSYYGKTPITVKLSPNKNYKASLINKDKTYDFEIKSLYSVRENRKNWDTARCTLDAAGSMLILPLFSLLSVKCRDFEHSKYYISNER